MLLAQQPDILVLICCSCFRGGNSLVRADKVLNSPSKFKTVFDKGMKSQTL